MNRFEDTDRYEAQIRACAQLLHRLEPLKPVIAGGAICSWISTEPARDLDIWIAADSMSTTNISKWQTELGTYLGSASDISHDVDGASETATAIRVFKTTIPVMEIGRIVPEMLDVDIVIYDGRDGDAVTGFDWTYSAMSWGWNVIRNEPVVNTLGLDDFANGEFVPIRQGDASRSLDDAMSKARGYGAFGTGRVTRLGFDRVVTMLTDAYPQTLEIGDTCKKCGEEWRERALMFSTHVGCIC
jgi:hypothetical protein